MFAGKTQASARLKGTAAEVKDLIPVLHKVWLKYYNPELEVHRSIEFVLRTSAHMDSILSANYGAFAIPSPDSGDLLATGIAHYNAFWKLRQHFADSDYPCFQLTSKGLGFMVQGLGSRVKGLVFGV